MALLNISNTDQQVQDHHPGSGSFCNLKFLVENASQCTLNAETNEVHLTNIDISSFMKQVVNKSSLVRSFLKHPDIHSILQDKLDMLLKEREK